MSPRDLLRYQPKIIKEFWADDHSIDWWLIRKSLKKAKILRSFLYDHNVDSNHLQWLSQRFHRTLREFFPIYDFDSSKLQNYLPNLQTVSFNLYSLTDWKSVLKRTNIKCLNVLNMPCRVSEDDHFQPLPPEQFERLCARFAERLYMRRDLEKIHVNSSFDARMNLFLKSLGQHLPLFQEKVKELCLTFTHERELRNQLDKNLQKVFERATRLKLHTYEDTSFLKFLKENISNFKFLKVLYLSFNGSLPNYNDLAPLQALKDLVTIKTFTIVLNDTSYHLLLVFFENFTIPINTESITLSFIFPSWTVFNHKVITSKPSFEEFLKRWEGLKSLKNFDFEINDGALAEGFTNKLIENIFPRLSIAERITIHCTEIKGVEDMFEEEKDDRDQILNFDKLMLSVQHLLPTLERMEINIPILSIKNLPVKLNIEDSKLAYLRLGNRCVGADRFGDLINLVSELEAIKAKKNGFHRKHKKAKVELDIIELQLKNNKALTSFLRDLVQSRNVYGKIQLNTKSIEKEHFVKNICSNMRNLRGKYSFNLKFLTGNMRHEDLETIGRTLAATNQFCPVEIESIEGIKMGYFPGRGYKITSLKTDESIEDSSINWVDEERDSNFNE